MTTARISLRPTSNIKQQDRLSGGLSACRKSMFFQKKCLFSIPIPKPLSPWEGLCMLCWLCIVQSLWAYTPGIRAGAECGATAPRLCWGLRPSTPFFDNNRGFSIVCPRREFNPFPYRTFCTWSNYDSSRSAQALLPQTDTFPMCRLH